MRTDSSDRAIDTRQVGGSRLPPHPAQPTERVHPEQHPIPGKPRVGDHPGYEIDEQQNTHGRRNVHMFSEWPAP